MNPPPIIWYADYVGIAAQTDSPPPGAVPYMLARPMPIETAPRDGTKIIGIFRDGTVAGIWYSVKPPHKWREAGWQHDFQLRLDADNGPTRWLHMPPAPEET